MRDVIEQELATMADRHRDAIAKIEELAAKVMARGEDVKAAIDLSLHDQMQAFNYLRTGHLNFIAHLSPAGKTMPPVSEEEQS